MPRAVIDNYTDDETMTSALLGLYPDCPPIVPGGVDLFARVRPICGTGCECSPQALCPCGSVTDLMLWRAGPRSGDGYPSTAPALRVCTGVIWVLSMVK